MELLFKDGYASINENGDMSLIDAVSGNCEPETVKWLLEHGADPALTGKNGDTALDYAVERGYEELIPILEEALSTADEP